MAKKCSEMQVQINNNIVRNSEPDKAGTRDNISIKNFVFLAFDWSINFKNVICRARARMHYGDSRGSSC